MPTVGDEDAVLPATRLDDDTMAEEATRRIREILEYQLTDVSGLGEAVFPAARFAAAPGSPTTSSRPGSRRAVNYHRGTRRGRRLGDAV
jgi:hypothetical protein